MNGWSSNEGRNRKSSEEVSEAWRYSPFLCLVCGQLLPTTDVTATRIAPAAPPTPTAASGATTRSAFQQTATAAW